MMKTSLLRAARPLAQQSRLFNSSVRTMAEGDLGAPKGGAGGQTDSFQKREEANENYYIKQKEREQLLKLKEKLAQHKAQLDNLEKDIKDMEGKK